MHLAVRPENSTINAALQREAEVSLQEGLPPVEECTRGSPRAKAGSPEHW
jgi:hypothetical protein